ncbi:MAG: hypothetical protein HY264_04940 [Chloroflexi bacterium]|nr:hypothetical protein [Chloroflexota bacterium]
MIAWRDLPSLRDPARFDAWMHRLLTNVCIAEAGHERRSRRLEPPARSFRGHRRTKPQPDRCAQPDAAPGP